MHSEKPILITNFISIIESEITKISLSDEISEELKKHLSNADKDYHSIQTIIDILISLPLADMTDGIIKIRNKLQF